MLPFRADLCVVLFLCGNLPCIITTGSIHGECYFNSIIGSPSVGRRYLYETNLFLSPPGDSIWGPSRRLGAPPHRLPTYDGRYNISNLPAGNYSAYVSQPAFFIRPKVQHSLSITDNNNLHQDILLPMDYSSHVLLPNSWPQQPQPCWYQTFKATGQNVVGCSINFAAAETTTVEVSILKSEKGNITEWTTVCSRPLATLGKDTDSWAKWRSGECPTANGDTYAVKWCAKAGGGIQPYWRKKDSLSYKHGHGWDSTGTAVDYDITGTVFSDNDGTIIPVRDRVGGVGYLKNNWWSKQFGITWTATGNSLAGVDVWAAGASNDWNITMSWSIHNGSSPEAPKLNVATKTTRAAYQAAGFGLHGVSWNPSEITLTSGALYTIVWSVTDPPSNSDGFNTCASHDKYPSSVNGWHYNLKTSKWEKQMDVPACTIMEYS